MAQRRVAEVANLAQHRAGPWAVLLYNDLGTRQLVVTTINEEKHY